MNEIIGVLADGPRGVIRIYAKAVVLATGGWASNAQLMQANISRYFASMRQRNAAGAGKPPFLGDGLFAALQLGGQLSTGGFDSRITSYNVCYTKLLRFSIFIQADIFLREAFQY